MSMWNFSSLRLHCKIKSKASHKFQSLIKIHITFMIGLFAKQTGTKISLSDQENHKHASLVFKAIETI